MTRRAAIRVLEQGKTRKGIDVMRVLIASASLLVLAVLLYGDAARNMFATATARLFARESHYHSFGGST